MKIILTLILALTVFASCKKVGKERFSVGEQVDIKKGETRRGNAPYTITGFYRHAVEQDDAQYTIVSVEGLRTLNIEDNLLIGYRK